MTPNPNADQLAEELYREARARWAAIVDLSVYDDEEIITRVASALEPARAQDPKHVKTLVLLSDILMQLGALDEAMDAIDTLVELEPTSPTHAEKKRLVLALQADFTSENRDAVREFIEERWTETDDW